MPDGYIPTRNGLVNEYRRSEPFVARASEPSVRLAALLDARRELIEGIERHPEWAEREAELYDRLRSVLNRGDLYLERIDSHTPQAVLDQIVKYEAVHPIRGRWDLERRIAEDRRCYALFHPDLPHEPLIFTEVALTNSLSADVRALLAPEPPIADPSSCTYAIFYSISSCHKGLRGVSLGNALIRRVADELARALPRLETFATLSPAPGFRTWLTSLVPPGTTVGAGASAALARLGEPGWQEDIEAARQMERLLVPLCAYYLLRVTRLGEALDPVARFHFRNGARLERVNWLSDTSSAGMRRAAGLMVNYLYRSRRCRYDAWTRARRVSASRHVKNLAQTASGLLPRHEELAAR